MTLVANSLAAPCGGGGIQCQQQRQACGAPSTSSGSSRVALAPRPLIASLSRRRRSRAGLTVCEIAVGSGAAAAATAAAGVGSRIRVKGSLKVYHIPRTPEFDLDGQEGVVKEVLTSWKGKTISANLPFKCQFVLNIEGKEVKTIAHLREGEFEVIG